ncbi:MAG TPA: peptide ABC transporter substrate-binding protein [Chloroflexota bacterium]|nr:peptide ABC transporter substrate-binding protein [Chloroflexota bacterium]
MAAVRVEPESLATRPPQEAGVALYLTKGMFNAELAVLDTHEVAQPNLAESLPQLNTDTWRVFPDGRMQTTYRLKPNLTWHDGAPLTADDFVFAWQTYTLPQLGQARLQPWNAIEDVSAADDRTVVVRWSRPYPDAGSLTGRNRAFPPLPRHLLQEIAQPDQVDALVNSSYWTRDFVGLGPFKLDRWEPGAFIDASAFDGYARGRAKIERIHMLFMSDASTVLANLLGGQVHLSADTSLRLEEAQTLKGEWGPRGLGTVLEHPNQWRATNFQFRPEIVSPRALLDVRVRKALAYAVDKDAINDALYHGSGVTSDFIISPASEWGPAVVREMVKYPFDLRQSDRLMTEAGFTRGPDGTYANPSGGRFTAEIQTNGAADNSAEQSILASGWRQAGFDVQESILPAALAQDGQARASFSSMFTNNTNSGEASLLAFTSRGIPTADNHWTGGNRGGWSNADYDRLAREFDTTLDHDERMAQIGQMAKLFTDDVASISLFFRTQPWAFVSSLSGLEVVGPEASMAWNINAWEFR